MKLWFYTDIVFEVLKWGLTLKKINLGFGNC